MLSAAPLLRLALLMALGTWLAWCDRLSLPATLLTLSILAAFGGLAWSLTRDYRPIALHLLWILFGYGWAIADMPIADAGKIANSAIQITSAWAPAKSGGFQKAEIKRIGAGEIRAILYVRADAPDALPLYGDLVQLSTVLSPIEGQVLPWEFDYPRYMAFRGITHQAFCSPDDLRVYGNDANPLWTWAYAARRWSLRQIERLNLSGHQTALLSGLLIGEKLGMDAGDYAAFRDTGTLHILSVSGLHVGLMYGLVMWVLAPIGNLGWRRFVRLSLGLIILWAYAYLCGLNPAVVRAAMMLSAYHIGIASGRVHSAWNALGLAAILALLWQPAVLFQIGFGLSFLAVAGLMGIAPRLEKLWSPKIKILKWTWSLTCVSLAAQLATLPLTLLYFHQFPIVFLLGNLLLIPIAALAMYAGTAAIALSWLGPIKLILAYFTGAMLSICLWLVNWVAGLVPPYNGIYITPVEAALLALLLTTLGFLLHRLSTRRLRFALACGLIFSLLLTVREWDTLRGRDTIVIKGKSKPVYISRIGQALTVRGDALPSPSSHFLRAQRINSIRIEQ